MGRCPKTPVAGCAGYGLIFDGSPKSIRTAHRIAPKVAAAHLPFPPTPFPDGGKGARMGGQLKTDSNALGVLGLAEGEGRGGWGFGAERRRWRMKRGGESVAVEKIERTNSAKIFSGTARRAGLRLAEEASPPEAETSPQGMRRAGRPARPARGSSRPARRCRPGRRSRPGGPPGGRGCPVRCGVPDNPAG